MSSKMIRIIETETRRVATVLESSFRKVWANKGWELLEDVERREREGVETSEGETEVKAADGEQVAASTDKGAEQTAADAAAAKKAADDAKNQKAGETATGDSKQSSTPNV